MFTELIIISLAAFSKAAESAFDMCTAGTCEDCPVSLTSAGTGYPNCVIYNSADIFSSDLGFTASDGGGWMPFLNVDEQDQGCAMIVKSPAYSDVEGCGNLIASFKQPACATLPLEKTFMVQFCCGTDDCTAAGASKRSAKFGRRGSGGGGVYLKHANGTIIKPAYEGPVTSEITSTSKASLTADHLFKRSKCTDDSWVADASMESYTRPADGSQIVATGVSGGQTIAITTSRTSEYSSTIGADFGFSDIFSMGISTSETFTESITDSTERSFEVPTGQSGDIGFTALWMCSTGSGTCNGGTVSGEVCTPYKDASGSLAGSYNVIVHS